MLRTKLLASAAAASLALSDTAAFAQTPDMAQLYKMVLQTQSQLAETRSELATTRRRLEIAEKALRQKGRGPIAEPRAARAAPPPPAP